MVILSYFSSTMSLLSLKQLFEKVRILRYLYSRRGAEVIPKFQSKAVFTF